jgi:hypothetical protein
MRRILLICTATLALLACEAKGARPSSQEAPSSIASTVARADADAAARARSRAPGASRTIYSGTIYVSARDYTQTVKRGGDFVTAPVAGLDDVVTPEHELHFTLDYPFEKPYAGVVRSESGITLRQIIDAVRASFRAMYQGASQRDIPGMFNKDVRGDYGRAFHVIDDLVIAEIALRDDGGLEIEIES